MYRWSMMKNIHSPNWVRIGSWGPEIWPLEYISSPTEISANWSGSKQLWTRPIFTGFNGLIRYSCSHISGHHEPIHVKFGVWEFFLSCSTEILSWKCWNAKKKIWWCHTSVLYTQFKAIHNCCNTQVWPISLLSQFLTLWGIIMIRFYMHGHQHHISLQNTTLFFSFLLKIEWIVTTFSRLSF